MKKLIITFTTFLFLIGGGISIQAAAPEGENGKYKTDASVSFLPGDSTEIPEVVDPEPSVPGEPEEGTGDKGPLSLDYVPALPFGSHKLAGKPQSMYSTNRKAFVQVTDLRGTNAGWNVSLQLSTFIHETDSTSILKDAKIDFSEGVVRPADNSTAEAPETNAFTIEAGKDAVTVLDAKRNQGAGKWQARWITTDDVNQHIKLSADTSSALVGSYEATAEWTLSVTPSSR